MYQPKPPPKGPARKRPLRSTRFSRVGVCHRQCRLKGGKQLPGDSITDPASGLPIGPLVNASPARRPERIVLRGRLVTIAPLDPAKHAESLFSGTHGPDKENIWLYLGDGPFADRGAFRGCLEKRAKSHEPPPFSIAPN